MPPTLTPLGDSAWLVLWPASDPFGENLPVIHDLMRTLQADAQQPPGVTSIIAAFESLAVRYDPSIIDGHIIRTWIESSLNHSASARGGVGEYHEIPVHYGGQHGPDLEAVAKSIGKSVEQIISLHCSQEYTVAMIGFAPGFPYLTGLHPDLQLPRLTTPRNRVPAGSVAIAGEQSGIYSCDSPGGWHILGRTTLNLFDPCREGNPSLLKPGDRITFVPSDAPPPAWQGNPARNSSPTSLPIAEILEPGFITTIQDQGRPHFESAGVSPGGAMDRDALKVANLLLGNPPDAAALEISVNGPTLRFLQPTRIVLVGADSSDGLRHAQVRKVAAGETIVTGTLTHSFRAILGIAGGIEIPKILGSRSTDVRAGFGGFRFKKNDILHTVPANPSPPPTIHRTSLAAPVGRMLHIRYLPGPQADWFTPQANRTFQSHAYEITSRQDRMGMRLHGPMLELISHREMRSQPVCTGSIQIPPDGRPMILLAERQTHGGYPQIGCVITADIPKIVRALPGTRIQFSSVTLEEAWWEIRQACRDFKWLSAGILKC